MSKLKKGANRYTKNANHYGQTDGSTLIIEKLSFWHITFSFNIKLNNINFPMNLDDHCYWVYRNVNKIFKKKSNSILCFQNIKGS